jgi:hypothetical protein
VSAVRLDLCSGANRAEFFLGVPQVLSGVALLSYRAAKAPKDREHPYGQSQSLPVPFLILSYICSYLAKSGW